MMGSQTNSIANAGYTRSSLDLGDGPVYPGSSSKHLLDLYSIYIQNSITFGRRMPFSIRSRLQPCKTRIFKSISLLLVEWTGGTQPGTTLLGGP